MSGGWCLPIYDYHSILSAGGDASNNEDGSGSAGPAQLQGEAGGPELPTNSPLALATSTTPQPGEDTAAGGEPKKKKGVVSTDDSDGRAIHTKHQANPKSKIVKDRSGNRQEKKRKVRRDLW